MPLPRTASLRPPVSPRPIRHAATRTHAALLVAASFATAFAGCGGDAPDPERERWEATAARVTITRDDWGIPHIAGPTDADAVFGMMYAQAEDDFPRIERNYLDALGRRAEADGEAQLWRDLRQRLFVHPDSLRALHDRAPDWMRALTQAWADGLNYYLATHPEVRPQVITRFEPWMALSFTEGSIGGDIEDIGLRDLAAFYGGQDAAQQVALAEAPLAGVPREPTGSNGFAIAPSNTANGHALLLINPHTSFYFRHEAHVRSDEGLNAYGASTWGQFFVYQGFNDRAGWMHTSSGADVVDEWSETVVRRNDSLFTVFGDGERPVRAEPVTLRVRTDGGIEERTITVYHTHHGPVVRADGERWIAVNLMFDPIPALEQSYGRTKARTLEAFRATMEKHTNSSNNTVYADADGHVAYFHANFVPRRDARLDWSRPVDGRDTNAVWRGVHGVDESPLVIDPASGWIQNTNNWPYSAAGANSPRRADYPAYMDEYPENPRGIHAVRVLDGVRDFTRESLLAAAYDPWLPAFETLLPPLLRAWERLPGADPRRTALAGPIDSLRGWDHRWSAASVPTTLAVFWGEILWRATAADARRAGVTAYEYMETRAADDARLDALARAVDSITAGFGTWATPWGEVNRFQRTSGAIDLTYDDSLPSLPVPFTSARWGSLASFGARAYPGTHRWYGSSGNSFVAVVEFGDRVSARAVTAGGLSNDPASPHFRDQAERYASGDLREVYFHADQLEGHVERTYRPGER